MKLALLLFLSLAAQDRRPLDRLELEEPTTPFAFELQALERVDSTNVPAVGLEVEVGFVRLEEGAVIRSLERVPLYTGKTGIGGKLAVEVELPIGLDIGLWASVRSPGYQRAPRFHTRLEKLRSRPLMLVAQPGGTIAGTVHDEHGEPVEGATIECVERRASDAVAWGGRAQSWADGRFELDFYREGSMRLHARKVDLGSAASRELDLRRKEPVAPIELTLRGAGVLAGTMVDGTGAPLRTTALHVVPADRKELFDRNARAWLESGDGIVTATLQTDEHGRFRVAGLAPGRYRFLEGEQRRVPIAAGPFEAGAEGITLHAGGHRLVVRAFEPGGEVVALRKPESTHRAAFVCVRADEHGRALPDDRWDMAREMTEQDDGSIVVELVPDRSYLVGYIAPDRPLILKEVFLPFGERRVEVVLELPGKVEPARLSVEVVGPEGRSHYAVRAPLAHTDLRVRDRSSGLQVGFKPRYRRQSSASFRLPPGDYVVHAEEQKSILCGHGLTEPLVADFAPAEFEVTLGAGQHADVEVALGASGRIEVEVDLPAWQERSWDELDLLAEEEGGGWDAWRSLWRRIGGLRVRIVDADGEGRLLDFHVPPLGTNRFPWVLPGVACRSTTPIRPGCYQVVGETADGRVLRGTVEVAERQTTGVLLR